jgi:hypothetical protein
MATEASQNSALTRQLRGHLIADNYFSHGNLSKTVNLDLFRFAVALLPLDISRAQEFYCSFAH